MAKIRPEVRRAVRKRMRKSQRDLCAVCGGPMLFTGEPGDDRFATIDHIIPKSLGGVNAQHNLRLVHRKCNLDRGDTRPAWQVLVSGLFANGDEGGERG